MKSLFILAAAAVLAAPFTAQAQKGGVAIVDIDAVAKELGVTDTVTANINAEATKLNSALAGIKQNLQGQMNNLEAQAGQQRSAQIQSQLVNANRQLNQAYDQEQAKARQIISNYRVQQIRDFQEKLKPVALEVAKAEGFHVVMMKVSPPVFTFAEAADITEKVTAAAKKANIKIEAISATAAPAPAPAPAPAADKGKGKAEPAPKGKGEEKGKGKN